MKPVSKATTKDPEPTKPIIRIKPMLAAYARVVNTIKILNPEEQKRVLRAAWVFNE